MSATQILLSLAGEIALLLWGIHMVSNGAQRALGSRLTGLLTLGMKSRGRAFLTGIGVTTLLQSSTATALMASSFTAGGLVALTPALALMLGANVGTTLIVQVVSFDISNVFPALILAGFIAYRTGRVSAIRDTGTALVGLGLMLLALHLLIETMRPIESSQALGDLLHAITRDPVLNLALAALLSWAAHSSVAAVLLTMSLVGADVITTHAALAMVLGANLGSALNPVVANLGGDPVRMRLPIGNLATRLIGCVVALPMLGFLPDSLPQLGASPARAAANFHLAFNLATAAAFIGVLPLMARLLTRLFPTKLRAMDPGAPQYLDESALRTPSVALSNAAREVLRMADVVESMLRASQEAFHHEDAERVSRISEMDDILDRLYGSIQRYLGAISQEAITEAEAQRLADTLALAINMEHIGDIIDRSLRNLAAKRIKAAMKLPGDAEHEIDEMHLRLLDHLQLAVAVFMFGDPQAARRLVTEKEAFRDIERASTQRHFVRMREGRRQEIDASALQLDVTRDLKRIEAHIAATAYSLLEQTGELRASRLSPN